LLVLVCVLVSQPFERSPSQFPQPELQVIPHAPPVHVAVPFVELQTVPQAPQCVGDVLRLVSQPLFGLPSQSAKPVLQTGVHTPLTHEVVPLPFVHALPHVPQFAVVVCRFTSQPFEASPSQFP
jgi:hypothetical protein